MTTGFADPMDDFYDGLDSTIRDLDAAIEASRAQLADMVDDRYRRKLDPDAVQTMVEEGIDPGYVWMLADTPTGLDLIMLGQVDRYVFDPDAAEDTR